MDFESTILIVLFVYTQSVNFFENKPEKSVVASEIISAINQTTFLSLSGLASTTSHDALRFLRKVFAAAGVITGLLISTPFVQNKPVLTSVLVIVFLILLWVVISGFEWQEKKKQILVSTYNKASSTLKNGTMLAGVIWAFLTAFEAMYPAFIHVANGSYGDVPILTESALESAMVNNVILIVKCTMLGYGCVLLLAVATLLVRFMPAWLSLAFIKLMIIFSRSSIRIGTKRRVSVCNCVTYIYAIYFGVSTLYYR